MKFTDQQLAILTDKYTEALSGSEVVNALRHHASLANVNLKYVALTGLPKTVVFNILKAANSQAVMDVLLNIIASDGIQLNLETQPATIHPNAEYPALKITSWCTYLPTNQFIPDLDFPVLEGWITNPKQHNQLVFLKTYISSFSDSVTVRLDVAPGGISIPHFRYPRVTEQNGKAITNTIMSATLAAELMIPGNTSPVDIFQGRVFISQPDFVLIARQTNDGDIEDYSGLLSWAVNSGAAGIDKFLANRVSSEIRQNIGYKTDLEANEIWVDRQTRDIYKCLQELDIAFLPTETLEISEGSSELIQRIQSPEKILNSPQTPYANCLDGAILFASIVERMNLCPILVLIPKHALVGWKIYPSTVNYLDPIEVLGKCVFIDTTLMSAKFSFEAAVSAAEGYILRYANLFQQPPANLMQFAKIIDVKTSRIPSV